MSFCFLKLLALMKIELSQAGSGLGLRGFHSGPPEGYNELWSRTGKGKGQTRQAGGARAAIQT